MKGSLWTSQSLQSEAKECTSAEQSWMGWWEMQAKWHLCHTPWWDGHAISQAFFPELGVLGCALHGDPANRDFLLWLSIRITGVLIQNAVPKAPSYPHNQTPEVGLEMGK